MKNNRLLKTALSILGYEVIFGVAGLLLTSSLSAASAALRMPLVGLIIAAAWALVALGGAAQGETDYTMTETLDKLAKKNGYVPSADEKAKRFSRGRAVLGAALGGLLLFAAALCVAVTAQPYAYSLQDTPSWLNSYMARPEIGNAVAYMQGTVVKSAWTDYVRVGVRFALFPYVSLLGEMTDAASLLFDRVSPLVSLLLPACYAIGYQFGPQRYARTKKAIEEAKSRPRKRLKKEARQRLAGKKPEKKELI